MVNLIIRRAAHPDLVAIYTVRHREYKKKHYAANKETILANNRAWGEANKERMTEYKNEWSRQHGGGHRGRAKRFGVIYTSINKIAIFKRDNWICGICGVAIDKTIPWPDPLAATLDHIIPMSRGGDHVVENVQASHWVCNLTKRDSLP